METVLSLLLRLSSQEFLHSLRTILSSSHSFLDFSSFRGRRRLSVCGSKEKRSWKLQCTSRVPVDVAFLAGRDCTRKREKERRINLVNDRQKTDVCKWTGNVRALPASVSFCRSRFIDRIDRLGEKCRFRFRNEFHRSRNVATIALKWKYKKKKRKEKEGMNCVVVSRYRECNGPNYVVECIILEISSPTCVARFCLARSAILLLLFFFSFGVINHKGSVWNFKKEHSFLKWYLSWLNENKRIIACRKHVRGQKSLWNADPLYSSSYDITKIPFTCSRIDCSPGEPFFNSNDVVVPRSRLVIPIKMFR